MDKELESYKEFLKEMKAMRKEVPLLSSTQNYESSSLSKSHLKEKQKIGNGIIQIFILSFITILVEILFLLLGLYYFF